MLYLRLVEQIVYIMVHRLDTLGREIGKLPVDIDTDTDTDTDLTNLTSDIEVFEDKIYVRSESGYISLPEYTNNLINTRISKMFFTRLHKQRQRKQQYNDKTELKPKVDMCNEHIYGKKN